MSEYEVTCPHSDCDDVVALEWHLSYLLDPSDLNTEGLIDEPTSPDVAHSCTWQIECMAGHVLLIPGPLGCSCDDPEGPTCTHDPDRFDWSEESRTFRAHDWARLRAVLAALADDPAEVTVPHEHDWISIRTFEDAARRDPQVCSGCSAKRVVREQISP